MKNIMFKLSLALGLASFVALSSCSKSDSSPSDGTIEIQYRFIGSPDVKIENVVYYDGDSPVTNTSADKGSTWTSPKVKVKKMYATGTANGIGTSSSSTLKAQIIENGSVVKESAVSTGEYLNVMISY